MRVMFRKDRLKKIKQKYNIRINGPHLMSLFTRASLTHLKYYCPPLLSFLRKREFKAGWFNLYLVSLLELVSSFLCLGGVNRLRLIFLRSTIWLASFKYCDHCII